MDPAMLDAGFWLTLAAIAALLLLSAFFSGAETALTAASRARLRAQAERGDPRAEIALAVVGDSERVIGAILLGRTLVNVLVAVLGTVLLTRLFGALGPVLAAVLVTLLVLVFGEVLPKTCAISFPEPLALRVAPLIRGLAFGLAPLVAVVRGVVRGMLRLFGVQPDPDSSFLALREDLMDAIAVGHSEGLVEKEDRDRLLATLDLSDRTVEEVMKHRSGIEMVNADDTPDRILNQALASPHTRLPLWRDEPENIVGVIHAKDLLREVNRLVREDAGGLAALDVLKVARKPYFVPETTDLDDQMRQFLARRTHFALVVDEYGALRGLITLEDIIEEIVGEITDEFDVARVQAPRPTPEGDYLVDGAMTIRDLNRALDWSLPDGAANTIAGLVIHEAQTIPAQGQVFSFYGVRFEVVTRRENRITRIKLRPL